MLNLKKDDKLIELKEVCEKLKFKDIRTAIKWCKKTGIPVIPRGKQKLTYKFLVDIELDRDIVKFLKSEYPKSWKEMYTFYLDNDKRGYVLAIEEYKVSSRIEGIVK
ncbi:hypothetical protein IWQ47_003474 [Aquimarina sp. EL_43]|uniref:hypothetical protein n=1 Tax=Aquimarina TaxID=290174 RepID=UPI000D54B1A8|nr:MULTISPECIES: hypothetical protein [Aquimarina]MBG6131784.1 hypothetical protein [Aquimarina sp. EL_35]MBG6149348.1 hypothetical protein [Aquimarina sp. EL_32]MBG6170389.1 hypothetical protein [Aquimarina sp. EL_43]